MKFFHINTIAIIAILLFGQGVTKAAPVQPSLSASSAVVIDPDTNFVFYSKNINAQIYPASITKLMLLYIAFENIQNGSLNLDDYVTVDKDSVRRGGEKSGSSTMFLIVNEKVKVKDLLYGIAVQSGNDASISLAKHIAGSEALFVDQANKTAKKLGMSDTHFVNITGWPDKNHYSTINDISILASAIVNDYPKYSKLFSVRQFTHNGITQPNRNPLLNSPELGVIGLKTGHTEQSKYSVAIAAIKDGHKYVGAISGSSSSFKRKEDGMKMLKWVYNNFRFVKLFNGGDTIANIRIWNGDVSKFKIETKEDLYVPVPKGVSIDDISITLDYINNVSAPISQGDIAAKILVNFNSEDYKSMSYSIDYIFTQDITVNNSIIKKIITTPLFIFSKIKYALFS